MDNATMKLLATALERCLVSPNVADSNMEAANVVDVIDHTARGLDRIAHAITPRDAAPARMPEGGAVASLTEAVIYQGQQMGRIADAIHALAQAVQEHNS